MDRPRNPDSGFENHEPRDEAPAIPGEFGIDTDPYLTETPEDEIPDGSTWRSQDQPLPKITEDVE